jgi:DNA-binding response OmpR family regulator
MIILIVEDDDDIASLLRRGFGNEGHDVTWARTGREGLEQGRKAAFDIIILDIMLPELSGIEVCRGLRSSGPNVATPILMLSARDSVGDRVEGLSAGADDYVIKPFAFEELLARVQAQERRQRQTGEGGRINKLTSGDLTLDLTLREVTWNNRRVELTERECDLLAFFMRRADEPLSRNAIFDALWEGHGGVSINVVDVYVGYLRRKLVKPGDDSKPLIQTVRGVGFVFRTPEGGNDPSREKTQRTA